MSITDELRELTADPLLGYASQKVLEEVITAIADRIDAEHKRAVMSAMNDALYHANDESMAELGWVRLPKDANGEYIQPSDIPYLTTANDGKRLAYYPSLELRQDETWRIAGWTPDRYRILKPTVEDVLQELVIDWDCAPDGEDKADVLKEYAAKLQLKEDE